MCRLQVQTQQSRSNKVPQCNITNTFLVVISCNGHMWPTRGPHELHGTGKSKCHLKSTRCQDAMRDARMRCAMSGCDARCQDAMSGCDARCQDAMRDGRMRCSMLHSILASHPAIAHRILPSRIASCHRASHPAIAHRILPSRIAHRILTSRIAHRVRNASWTLRMRTEDSLLRDLECFEQQTKYHPRTEGRHYWIFPFTSYNRTRFNMFIW